MWTLNSVPRAPGVRSAVAVAVCVCACGAATVRAADEGRPDGAAAPSLEPVVVTASRLPTPLGQVLADVTVIDREAIERQGASDLATLLSRQGGIEFDRNGGPASATGVFLRGANARFTAVLIDGQRVDSQNLQGGASWQSLPLAAIDRIEIVRGAASALYGSDAVAGVIQIFTRQGRSGPPVLDLGLALGARQRVQWDASIAGAVGRIDFAVTGAHEQAVGASAITEPSNFNFHPDDDGHRLTQWTGRFGLQMTPGQRVELSSTRSRSRAAYDEGETLASPWSTSTVDTLNVRWTAQWTPTLTGRYSLGEASDAVHIESDYTFRSQTRMRTALAQHDWQLGDHALQLLLERRNDQLSDDADWGSSFGVPVTRRHQEAVGLGHGWASEGRSVQWKVRRDDDSEFGSHTTAALAVGWPLGAGWSARASVARAFRAPTLYERFATYGGSADLQPEASRQAELGLTWKGHGSRAALTWYRNRIEGLIDYDLIDNRYVNVGLAVLRGLSFTAETSWQGWQVQSHLDVQDPRNALTDQRLVRRAHVHGSVDIGREWAGWTLGAEIKASGDRFDDVANTRRLGGYALLNLYAQTQLHARWKLLVRVDNVLDKSYETAQDYAMPGFAGLVALRFTPGL